MGASSDSCQNPEGGWNVNRPHSGGTNTFAAASGAGIKDLMARMGHDSERAAMIYQHEARGADRAITGAIDAHVEAERALEGDDDDGLGDMLVPAG